ncbi:MAG TPA: PIG-L deacetylase family protein [Anaerolineaceae bacterium]|nr:PIG-L deacetylase family protein [Anaerolineaceae bacterium]
MPDSIEGWQKPQKILVMLAHPDDPEFFCGASIARWVRLGHSVKYCLLTKGDKGSQDRNIKPEELARIRVEEEYRASAVLGVNSVRFLDYCDGILFTSMETRRTVARVIRQEKPDILVTCDPTNYFPREGTINHPDHRTAGQIVLDGYFPAAGNSMFFPELLDEGLEPHSVKELWLSLPYEANLILDVTEYWGLKIKALHEHRSQIPSMEALDKRMLNRFAPDSTLEAPRYEEKFRRIVFA